MQWPRYECGQLAWGVGVGLGWVGGIPRPLALCDGPHFCEQASACDHHHLCCCHLCPLFSAQCLFPILFPGSLLPIGMHGSIALLISTSDSYPV